MVHPSLDADRSLAGFFSAIASNTRAEGLGVFSSETGRPDGMGMNISGGFQKLQQDAANLKISVQDKVDSDRSLAGFLSATASNTRAEGLGVFSSETGRPDGWDEHLKRLPETAARRCQLEDQRSRQSGFRPL